MTDTMTSDELIEQRLRVGTAAFDYETVWDEADKLMREAADLIARLSADKARMEPGDLYRDIFAEITAKAVPLCEDATDPEKITGYRLPVGPLHRAAGRLGFQMFGGEKRMQEMAERIAALEAGPQKLGPSLEQRMPSAEQIHDGLQRALGTPGVQDD